MKDASDRVTLGVAWLDEHEPGWLNAKVVVSRFDMLYACGSVLNRITEPLGGTFLLQRLGPGYSPEFGFDAYVGEKYEVLAQEWIERIRDMQAEAARRRERAELKASLARVTAERDELRRRVGCSS